MKKPITFLFTILIILSLGYPEKIKFVKGTIKYHSNGLIKQGNLNGNQRIQNKNYTNLQKIKFNINGHITNY